MDLTAYAKSIIDATAVDYGLVLHANQQGRGYWKRFVAESTLGAGALEPRLTVAWSGIRPTAAESTFDELGTSVSLPWSHAGLAPDAARLQLQISTDDFATVASNLKLKGKRAAEQVLVLATDELASGTYTWRIRAKYGDDPTWSDWSDAGTFTIAAVAVEESTERTEERFHQAGIL
jgi:hypothetical protein